MPKGSDPTPFHGTPSPVPGCSEPFPTFPWIRGQPNPGNKTAPHSLPLEFLSHGSSQISEAGAANPKFWDLRPNSCFSSPVFHSRNLPGPAFSRENSPEFQVPAHKTREDRSLLQRLRNLGIPALGIEEFLWDCSPGKFQRLGKQNSRIFLDTEAPDGKRTGKKAPEPLPAPGKSLGTTFRARHPSIPRLSGITGLSGIFGITGMEKGRRNNSRHSRNPAQPHPGIPDSGMLLRPRSGS